ncbi:MAG: tetrapyrrole biosynthesis, uroporphyrinogen III synthase [Olpidium bornovanus]|uniref:Tetrapyrrole biosynthesis, uroporphyrinogen III synthase n=1 Tax=Olpidium bornovanus TaxID=278681 RepID=A0A8H7ZPW9_9FUNG|nr:MAG: tetrapyrrole biosynthesis, uroporphyrinogen III synthase [Olpidium bornovanus]
MSRRNFSPPASRPPPTHPPRLPVLFLRARDAASADQYEAAAATCGYAAEFVEVLTWRPRGAERLRQVFAESERRWAGLVFTSSRAVRSLRFALAEEGEGSEDREQEGGEEEKAPVVPARWRSLPAFAVGRKTAESVQAAGFRQWAAATTTLPGGSADWDCAVDAAALAERIIKDHAEKEDSDRDLPYLFLAGDKRRDSLPAALSSAGVPLREVCAYETAPRAAADIERDLARAYPRMRGAPSWIVFFSPSGADAALPALHGAGLLRNEDGCPRIAAIGATTAAGLRKHPAHPLTVSVTASRPAAAVLLDEIARFDELLKLRGRFNRRYCPSPTIAFAPKNLSGRFPIPKPQSSLRIAGGDVATVRRKPDLAGGAVDQMSGEPLLAVLAESVFRAVDEDLVVQ